jgi:hypothetical protein
MSIATTLNKAGFKVGFLNAAGVFSAITDFVEVPYGIARLDVMPETLGGAEQSITALNGAKRVMPNKFRLKFSLNWEAMAVAYWTDFYSLIEKGLHYHLKEAISGTVVSTGTNTITAAANPLLSATNNNYNGLFIEFSAGGTTYQRKITAYNGATKVFTYAGTNVSGISGSYKVLQPVAFQTVWALYPNAANTSEVIYCVAAEAGSGYSFDITGGGVWKNLGNINLESRDVFHAIPDFIRQ